MPENVKVRMYRQGLGDCFLISLPRDGGVPFFILIDCGVILGTADPVKKMTAVVDDIAAATAGHIDLLVATHEHWDHLSGFSRPGVVQETQSGQSVARLDRESEG